MNGITVAGTYLPQARIARSEIAKAHAWAISALKGKSRGQRSAAAWDEDAITMAVESSRALLSSGVDIDQCVFASTSHPYIDRSSATIAATALGLADDVITSDAATSRRAATSALIQALRSDSNTLLLSGEKRIAKPGSWAEIVWGDAGAAVLVSNVSPQAQCLGWHSRNEDCPDFYTATGFHPYQGEERWIKEQLLSGIATPTICKAIEKAGVNAADITWAVLPDPSPGCEKALAKELGLNATLLTQEIVANAGDLGSSHPLFGLALALERAKVGDTILVASFGNGCDALIFKVESLATHASADAQLQGGSAGSYMPFINSRGLFDIDCGPRAERVDKTALSVHARYQRDITSFTGGKISESGAVQFPKSPTALDNAAATPAQYIDVCLASEQASVVSYTADYLTYTPQPPFCFGLVQFKNGARVAMEYVDVPSEGLEVGDQLEMRFRIKHIDRERGYRHYFWKAAPVKGNNGEQN
ncbi:MAG: 3-hydroxy-3-methylglutaryl CoA synthase/uncharacterized OB-fold protein [Zhongshania marina]|jgi:hydroxymethylglutaryl-CoA synthase